MGTGAAGPQDHLLRNTDLKGTKRPDLIVLNSSGITDIKHTETGDYNDQTTPQRQDGAENTDRQLVVHAQPRTHTLRPQDLNPQTQ